MGSGNIVDVSDGQTANVSQVNQYKSALVQDHVPRTTSGVATDVAGSIGTAALRWLKGYFGSVFIGAAGSLNSIEEDGSNNPIIKRNGSTVATFDANGLTRSSLSTLGQQTSSSSGSFETSATTLTDATNLTVTITTNGNPVFVTLLSAYTGTTTANSEGSVSLNYSGVFDGYIQIVRDSTVVSVNSFSISTGTHVFPSSAINFIDPVAAGTYTYKIQVKNNNASQTIKMYENKMVAYEL